MRCGGDEICEGLYIRGTIEREKQEREREFCLKGVMMLTTQARGTEYLAHHTH